MSGVRGRLASELTAEKALKVIEEAMDSTRQAWSFCPRCKSKVQADFPDHGARLKALEMWFEQGLGRPAAGAANVDPVAAGAEMVLADLEAMSLNALAAVAYGSGDNWARFRRYVAELEAIDWPPGFAEALERLERLVR